MLISPSLVAETNSCRPRLRGIAIVPLRAILMLGIAALVQMSGWAQTIPTLDTPYIMAMTKGPNQVNLLWSGVPNPGYGYLIEVQSNADSRYSSYTELQPIPPASGYTCDPSVVQNGATCNISDPGGTHVYNPTSNGVPYWVTDATYIDPQDGSAAQFIVWGLKPNTSYSFRVRSYSGSAVGSYSTVATATTANYPVRYVSVIGNDSNDGTDSAHAWLTLAHGSGMIQCGQELIVMGGNYANDNINMGQSCSAGNKAVVLVNPGDTAFVSPALSGVGPITLYGSYVVVDGITTVSATAYPGGGFDAVIYGNHDALLNVNISPAVIPSFSQSGVQINGDHNLIYRSYLHDYGSPDATQNPGGNGGFVLVLPGSTASNNVIWSSHLTRGGHDVSLCLAGCSHNRWLNNIMDGGWGMAWEAIYAGAQDNLVEGNFVKDVGQLITAYKPSFEVSQGPNTLRRNISVNAKNAALEVSALAGTVIGSLIYNNVFYNVKSCLFQSQNGGVTAYDYNLFANNICYKFPYEATEIYLDNTNSEMVYNSLLGTDPTGNPQPDRPIIIWAQDSLGSFQYPQTLAYADEYYRLPFSYNKGLDVVPQFVDEANLDFHLNVGSPLISVGTSITDIDWGSSMGFTDIGAFGIVTSTDSSINVSPAITISPTGATLSMGQTVSFVASVNGTPDNLAVSWSLSPRMGEIVGGVYVAPAAVRTAQAVIVMATSTGDPTKTATATVNLVPPLSTTTGLSSNLSPSTFGQSATFTAMVSPSGATGTVTFLDGSTTLGSGTLRVGVATFATASLSGGAHSITALYGGDSNYNISASSVISQTVNKANTATDLSPSLNPSNSGQSVTFTATVTPSNATGTVKCMDGATSLGSATLVRGIVTFTTSRLTVGTHSITASYVGDSNYNGSDSSNTVSQVVKSNFTISASPASLSLNRHGKGQYTVAVTDFGFSGAVAFVMTPSQSGPTANFKPSTVTGSSSTVMTVSSVVKGQFALTITGTGGGMIRTAIAILNVY